MARPAASSLSPSISESLRRLAGEARRDPSGNPPPVNFRSRKDGGSSEG